MINRILNKKYIKLFIITAILIAIFATIYYVDLNRFNSRFVKYDDTYMIRITYLIADRDKLKEDITIDETINENLDSVLYNAYARIPLTKDGEYLYANLSNFANKKMLEHVSDYTFANNNLNGEVIDGCFYDKKTNIIKIPFSYYENATISDPVQVEIESLLTKKEINNLKTDYSVKKLLTYDNVAKNELYELETSISLSNYINSTVSKDNLYIYINNSTERLDADSYKYNYKDKILTIYMPAITINRVDIKVGNNIIKNIFAGQLSDGEKSHAYKLTEIPSALIALNGAYYETYARTNDLSIDADSNDFIYCSSTGTRACEAISMGYTANSGYASYDRAYSTPTTLARYKSEIWPYVIKTSYVGTSSSGTQYLKFENNDTRILLECIHNSSAVSKAENQGLILRVSVVENHQSDNWLLLQATTYSADILNNGDRNLAGWGGQEGTAYFRVYWEAENCNLNVNKSVSVFNDSGTAKSTIGLYSDSSCNTLVDSKTTGDISLTNNASGSVTFTNLNLNTTYYVKETAFIDNSGSSDLLSNRYSYSSGCVTVSTADSNGDGICDTTPTLVNSQKSYCYSIKKTDAEDNNKNIGNTTWVLTGAAGDTHTATTNSSGIATFTGLKYQNYTLRETTANPADLDSNGTLDYWNDNSSDDTVSASSLTAGNSCSVSGVKKDKKVYYCLKVKKTDFATGDLIDGATFTATKGNITISSTSSDYSSNNGIISFFIGDSSRAGTYTVTETTAPSGYTINTSSQSVTATAMREYNNISAARSACLSGNTITSYNNSTIQPTEFKDKKLLINWYKVTEDGDTKINGATFKVKNSSGNYITVSNPVSQYDQNGTRKACYKYTGADSSGTTMTSGANGTTHIPMAGEVCISGLPSGTYTVIETGSPEYHTFGSNSSISLTTSNSFASMTNNNKLVNYPTEFRFTKNIVNTNGTQEGSETYTVTINGVTKTVSLSDMTTEELKKIGFSIYDSNNNVVSVRLTPSGYYEAASNNVDQAIISTNTTILHLDSNRQIYVKHLPKGTYTIKEVDTSNCRLGNGGYNTLASPTTRPSSAPTCSSGGMHSGDCIGYYSPDFGSASYSFTINDCSSTNASQNSSSCSSGGVVTKSYSNTPTEITFTKKDLYSYSNQADIIDSNRVQDSNESNVEFENAKERSDFDRIDFKVKDSNGNYLNFIYVGNTSSICGSDSDYSIYRYVPGLQLPSGVDPNTFNYHTASSGLTITQTLHACGGHIKLINLCRGETYTFEEVRVPDDSVYVLEKDGQLNPSVCFEVPCTNNETEQRTSKTAVINDKPTRVTFEKRDTKYNYLIPDEETTFEVYRCPKDSLCNPSLYDTVEEREQAGMKLIKFEPRSTIINDEEDYGIEVYRMMSDSDAENKSLCTSNQTSNCYVTSVHPDGGKLVLRYLQSGYNYVLLETVAPTNYILPTGTGRETPFVVVNNTVSVEEIKVPNNPTAIIIRKYADKDGDNNADNGELLGGAKFKIYKVTNYNVNKKLQDQEKELIKLKTIKDGVYEYRPVLDTDVITTCTGDSCSYDPISLGYNSELFEDIDDLINTSSNNVTSVLKEGTAIIQYLEYDTYYIIEEVEAPKGYSLPENDDNRFTLVHIDKNETKILDTEDALVNKPTSFTFYKFDEYNNPLDGAKFYLQKLDKDKKYNTLNVSMEELENGTIIYKQDDGSTLKDITTVDGKATVYYLEPGQYRILEVEAPEGYELPKKTINVATFFVDEDGLVYGNNIITNKKPAETIEYLASSEAKLIINIQTGKVVVKYGLIIILLISAIVGLMIFLKKRK